MKYFTEVAVVVFLFIAGLSFAIKMVLPNDSKNLLGTAIESTNTESAENKFIIEPLSTTTASSISAEGSILLYVNDGTSTILFAKNSDKKFYPASITKLITALVANDRLLLSASTTATHSILTKRGAINHFTEGARYDVENLLNALLIESNNDAAWMLSGIVGSTTTFTNYMNDKVLSIGATNTVFDNPVGLDPASSKESGNTSTAEDLAKIASYIYDHQPYIVAITRKKNSQISDISGNYTYVASSTNKLLSENIPINIIGGKTGETASAKKNFLLIFSIKDVPGYFVSVVLHSEDNFADTKTIIKELENSLKSEFVNSNSDNKESVANSGQI